MLEFITRRTLLALLILFLAISLLFGMIHMMPGDPASVILGPKASPELKAQLAERMGLDQPLLVQLGQFYANLARLDLGVDVFSDRAVADIETLANRRILDDIGLREDRMALDEALRGNGKPGIQTRLDRLEQAEAARTHFWWLVMGGCVTLMVMGLCEVIFGG